MNAAGLSSDPSDEAGSDLQTLTSGDHEQVVVAPPVVVLGRDHDFVAVESSIEAAVQAAVEHRDPDGHPMATQVDFFDASGRALRLTLRCVDPADRAAEVHQRLDGILAAIGLPERGGTACGEATSAAHDLAARLDELAGALSASAPLDPGERTPDTWLHKMVHAMGISH